MPTALPQDKPRKPDLSESEPYRCHNCKRHRVLWDGSFWMCTRLSVDPDTRDAGCGRQFVPDVYKQPE